MAMTEIDFGFDTTFIDNVVAVWNNKSNSFSAILEHPVFEKLMQHTEEYRNEKLLPKEYLNELLHIDGIDMRQHQKEIERNTGYIASIDTESLLEDVHEFLSEEQWRLIKRIVVFPAIGVAGLNLDDTVIIDPSPCPWFPCDGSDKEQYLQEFVLTVLRHEIHHLAFFKRFPRRDTKKITDWQALSEEMAIQIVAEGTAMLCENKTAGFAITDTEKKELKAFLEHFHDLCIVNKPDGALNDDDWSYYDSLWEEQLVYKIGHSIMMYLLTEMNMGIKECMSTEPIKLLGLAYDRLFIV